MNNKKNIVSLFDGISCARVALDKAKWPIATYFASEISKYSIQISLNNYPDIKHLGGVQNVTKFNFPHLFENNIDLLIGGSPCQDLSIAGKRKGLEGDRSGLFYEYVRILKEMKPKFFILENVNSMSKEARDTISKELGIEPIMINAALVSAQQRKRLFWVGKLVGNKYEQVNIDLPEDRNILLKDIIHETRGEKFDLEKYIIKANNLTWVNNPKTNRLGQFNKGGQGDRIYSINGKSISLSALGGGRGAKTGLYFVGGVANRTRNNQKQIEINKTGKSNAMTSVQSDSMVLIVPEATKQGYAVAQIGDSVDLSFPNSTTPRGRVGKKAKNLMTSSSIAVVGDGYIRKLTPIECCRLQGIPDDTTQGFSDGVGYRVTGDAFNADVIAHILTYLK